MQKLSRATKSCPGLETGKAPMNCSASCAEHYLPFWDTCGTFLQMLGLRVCATASYPALPPVIPGPASCSVWACVRALACLRGA